MKSRANFFFAASKLITKFGDSGELDGKEILTGMLRTFYKADDTKISEILKDGRKPEEVMADIANLDKERVKSLNTTRDKEKFQEGYKKGKSESLTEFEQKIRDEYGIDTDAQGLELLAEVVKAKAGESGGTGNEEEIKKTPTYQALEKRMKKELEDAKKNAQLEIDKLKTTYEREGVFSKVGEQALTVLTGLEPIFSTNQKVAETHKKNFLNELKGYEYKMEEDGTVLVSKDGKLLTDQHGHTKSYEDHVKEIAANHFEFKQNNGGANGGNNNDNDRGKGGNSGAYPAGIKKPKNADELAAIITNREIKPADKRIVMDTYKKENAK